MSGITKSLEHSLRQSHSSSEWFIVNHSIKIIHRITQTPSAHWDAPVRHTQMASQTQVVPWNNITHWATFPSRKKDHLAIHWDTKSHRHLVTWVHHSLNYLSVTVNESVIQLLRHAVSQSLAIMHSLAQTIIHLLSQSSIHASSQPLQENQSTIPLGKWLMTTSYSLVQWSVVKTITYCYLLRQSVTDQAVAKTVDHSLLHSDNLLMLEWLPNFNVDIRKKLLYYDFLV